MSNEVEHIHTLIIGSGPAGYTAAIYAARADLKPVMYTGLQPGGQLTTTTEVENFPGYPEGTQGPEMMEDFKKQAERFGTEVRFGIVTAVDFSSLPHKVTLDDGKTVTADAVIISTGASAKWLGLPSEQKYNGFGVSACAVCDGFFFRKQDVAIVGAGDTAAEEATYLAKLCQKVYMIVRKGEMRASKAMQHRVLNTPNIEVLYHSETKEILGDGQNVTGALIVNNETGEEKQLILPVSLLLSATNRIQMYSKVGLIWMKTVISLHNLAALKQMLKVFLQPATYKTIFIVKLLLLQVQAVWQH